jgi:hypothetical protein
LIRERNTHAPGVSVVDSTELGDINAAVFTVDPGYSRSRRRVRARVSINAVSVAVSGRTAEEGVAGRGRFSHSHGSTLVDADTEVAVARRP